METKTNQFKAEIAEMLDLVVNSLYSKKEIFLRELISNASDAIDRAKFLALTDKTLIEDNPEWKIEISVDKAAKTLMISDNGTGMDAADLEQNLGTIASSGTKAFRQALKEKGGENLPELIGQFGVGFYAAFMVADRVRVVSKKRGTAAAFQWESDMGGSYTISDSERDGFGTSVMLHLRDDQAEYLDRWRVAELVKKYSDFIAYPITFRQIDVPADEKDEDKKRREEDEARPLNTMVALWKRAKKDVKPEEYAEFYKHLTHDWDDPFETIPFSGEGQVEFKALLFLPKKATMELFMPQQKRGLSLYVRNVFIGDDIEMLLPSYLRFVKGVVDSSDLPLNVSREMLQDDAVIAKIKSAVTSKILSTLESMKKDEKKYSEFWSAFGTVLKEGVHVDWSNAERLKKLLKYPTARSDAGKTVFLEDYVKDMPSDQKDIYYLLSEREEDARKAPQLEAARKHGCDVLLFCDPVDEFLTESLREFDGKKFVDVAKGDVSFGSEAEQKAEKDANEKAAQSLKPFIECVKKELESKVSDVRVSTRLTDSPCCLVAKENALPPSMVRMMRAMKNEVPEEKRILELNAEHPLVKKVAGLKGEELSDAITLLYDSALIAEGSPVTDGSRFTKLLAGLMMKLVLLIAMPFAAFAEEQPVSIASSSEVVESNGLFRRVRTFFTFTNPNPRQMSCDFEFPMPAEATVCGYSLEIDGVMVPGVVVEKEKARVAFETEKAVRVDPGIVEHVAGNVWRTRIFPLNKDVPRKASVDYIEPVAEGDEAIVCERDGDDIFVATRTGRITTVPLLAKVAAFDHGVILWDASTSAEPLAAGWRKRLESLPIIGDWRLIVFSNEAETCDFKRREDLLAAINRIVYDGGTDISGAFNVATSGAPTLLFSDERDTLGVFAPQYERLSNVVIASRDEPPARTVGVRRLALGESIPAGVEVREGKLLATAWAADRVKDLACQAEARKDEFLDLGRRYGVASPVTSLIVLENLDQYLKHKIEPHKSLSFHDEWVRRRAAEDDQIAKKEAQADHERELLRLWKERVEWWLNPIPPKVTPHSGLFNAVASAMGGDAVLEEEAEDRPAPVGGAMRSVARAEAAEEPALAKSKGGAAPGEAGSGGATVTLAAWDPKAPYLDAIAKAEHPYNEYLVQKKSCGSSPAFYMDCASWFFKLGRPEGAMLGRRIISNMAEFGLDDAKVWRSMGWRLREAGEYEAAIRCFSKALQLRGEEGQSRRDLALVLSEYGKRLFAEGDRATAALCINEALALLRETAFTNFARRSGRASNDRQVSVLALEELNALIAWSGAVGLEVAVPAIDPAYRRDLPLRVRIVLSWDADETDIDIHVLEPDGEEAYYGHRRTSSGGFVSEDVTTGYGPEEYLRKEGLGRFKVLTNYFASHQTDLTGAATATATVYTDWGTAEEKMCILTLRLDKPKAKQMVGEIDLGGV